MPVVTSSLMEKSLKDSKSLKKYLRMLKKSLKIAALSASYNPFDLVSEETFLV